MSRILIVEDEPRIAALIERGLGKEGYETVHEEDGERGLERALQDDIDLILLDVGLPTMDGFEVLSELRGRGSKTPVIMLTARTSTRDTVTGLDGGASDYMPKPFTFEELLARVRARIRDGAEGRSESVLESPGVSLDLLTRRAVVDDRTVELSTREFALAEQFLRNAGTVLSREHLLRHVWGMDFDPGSNVVDVYVRYLRGKFGADRIKTVRGEGYLWP